MSRKSFPVEQIISMLRDDKVAFGQSGRSKALVGNLVEPILPFSHWQQMYEKLASPTLIACQDVRAQVFSVIKSYIKYCCVYKKSL